MSINKDLLHNALSYVHTNEAKDGRVNAAKYAANFFGLSEVERGILFNALQLQPSEWK